MAKNSSDRELVDLPALDELIAWDEAKVRSSVARMREKFAHHGKPWVPSKLEELSLGRRDIRIRVDDVLMDGEPASDLVDTYKLLTLENAAFRVFCSEAHKEGLLTTEEFARADERALVYSEVITGTLTFHMSAEGWEVRLGTDGLPYLRVPGRR